LLAQPEKRAREAVGELAKIALLDGGNWVSRLRSASGRPISELLWRFLKPAIAAKYRIVRSDPYETKGKRQLLNLGHTLGHVLEAHSSLPHGIAVSQGLLFSAHWSLREGLMTKSAHQEIMDFLIRDLKIPEKTHNFQRVPQKDLLAYLKADKKRASKDHLQFVFIRNFGRAIRRPVGLSEIAIEAREQGWLK
jgi:3-dehydroquinate synthase